MPFFERKRAISSASFFSMACRSAEPSDLTSLHISMVFWTITLNL